MPCKMSMGPLSAGVPYVGRLGAVLLHVQSSQKLDYKWYIHAVYMLVVWNIHISHVSSWQNYMKNWLLVASFVLRCQFQNSTLVMTCEKIKVGFHYLN